MTNGELYSDLRCVARRLAARPLYLAAVVTTLALSMGAALAVFGLVDGLILQPLQVPHPDELVTLQKSYSSLGIQRRRSTLSWSQVTRLQPIPSLTDMAVSTNQYDKLSMHSVVSTPDGRAAELPLRFVSWNYFRVMQVRILSGRSFQQTDDVAGAPVVAVASHAWWARESSASHELQLTVRINNVPVTVVGVLDGSFTGIELGSAPPALYLPLKSAPFVGADSLAAGDKDSRLDGDARTAASPSMFPAAAFQVVARTSAGRTALQSEVVTRLRSDQWSVLPLRETMLPFENAGELRRFITVLLTAVAMTLLMACLNVAVLMFADGEARSREFAIRSMLGAALFRLTRLVVLESVVVALLAGVGAIFVYWMIQSVAASLALPGAIFFQGTSVDPWRAGFFALVTCLVTAGLISIVPIRQAAGRLVEPGRESTADRKQLRKLAVLASVQTAACVMTALAAVLFLRAVNTGLEQDLGFRDDGLLTAEVALPREQRNEQALEHADGMLRDVRSQPGIRRATIGPAPLLAGSDWSTSEFVVDGTPQTTAEPVDMIYGADDYFKTIGQLGLRGRDFELTDTSASQFVVILNQAAAKLFWANNDAIGRKLRLSMFKAPSLKKEMEVIGVVPNVTLHHLGDSARPIIYLSRSQFHDYLAGFATVGGTVNLLIRSDVNPATLSQLLAPILRAHGQRLESLVSVAKTRRDMVQPQKFASSLLVFLGATIGVVTLIGAYTMGHTTVVRQQRAHAIRMALGATPADIAAKAARRIALTLTAGICSGVLCLWWTRPFVEPMALGSRLFDPIVVVAVVSLVLCACSLAAYVPLRRIRKTDPALLLRE